MGLIDTAAKLAANFRNAQVIIKQPQMAVTPSPTYDFTFLNDQENYFDNFISWTYKAVKIKADNVMFHPPKLIKYVGDKEIEITKYDKGRETQLIKDLMRWNPFQTFGEARAMLVYHKELAGLAVVYMCEAEEKGYKKEFYILDPLKIKVKKDQFGLPLYYEYTDGNGRLVNIPSEQIIIFRNANPKDWLLGYSPLQASRYAHNTYELASKYIMNMFGNNARPDGFMVFDGISEDERKRAEAQLAQKYGGERNSGKTGVLNKLFQWIPLSVAPKELDYVEVMRAMRDEILAIQGVPPALVFSDGNLNNTIEAQRIFQRQTIKPLLFQEAETLTEQLLPKYFGSMSVENLEFKFDDPVDLDLTRQSAAAAQLFTSGIITRNHALELIGSEKLEDEKGEEYGGQTSILSALQTREDSDSNNNQQDSQLSEDLEEVKQLVKSLKTKTEAEAAKEVREKKRQFYHEIDIERELEYKRELVNYWIDQAERTINSYNEQVPTLKNVFDEDVETDMAVKQFVPLYEELARSSADLANYEIKSQTDFQGKAFTAKILTPDEYAEINRIVRVSMELVNKTTADRIREVVAAQLINPESRNFRNIKNSLTVLYDNFIDGGVPAEYLRSIGAYAGGVEQRLNQNGLVSGGQDRYNRMLELLTNSVIRERQNLPTLEKEQLDKGLRALKSIVYKNPDSEAKTIDTILKDVYNVTDDVLKPCKKGQKALDKCGVPQSRTETVSTTETVRLRNYISRFVFEDNPLVQKLEWLTARDRFVRGMMPTDQYNHISADGQVVNKGQPFIVSGERLEFPGDYAGSAGNIINCRCTVLPVV